MSDPTPAELDLSGPMRRRLLNRRRFLKLLGGATVASVGGGVYSVGVEPHWVEVVRRDLPIASLPGSLDGRSMALLSDLHIGPVVDFDYIRRSMDLVKSLRPDLIVFTGDFITYHGGAHLYQVAEAIARVGKPPLGIAAVLGNHDYGERWASPAVADAMTAKLAGLGVRVLRNELAWVEGLQLVGLDDFWADDGVSHSSGPGKFFDPEAVLPTVDPGSAAIALVHNPDAADADGWGRYKGWILCGHTHGGQVDLPLIGPPILPVNNRRYVRGEIDLGDGRRLYINRGLGYLRRVRLFCRPEITLFTLRKG